MTSDRRRSFNQPRTHPSSISRIPAVLFCFVFFPRTGRLSPCSSSISPCPTPPPPKNHPPPNKTKNSPPAPPPRRLKPRNRAVSPGGQRLHGQQPQRREAELRLRLRLRLRPQPLRLPAAGARRPEAQRSWEGSWEGLVELFSWDVKRVMPKRWLSLLPG